MNQIYLRDQFLMVRDGDGEDPAALGRQLCRYYEERNPTWAWAPSAR